MSNKKKAKQLGMPHGTAANRLRKNILFWLLCDLEKDYCYRCGEQIDRVESLSIEHKEPWLDSNDSSGMYFDLSNIAFSHLTCNIGAARKAKSSHGTARKYELQGCRCKECQAAHAKHVREWRQRKKGV